MTAPEHTPDYNGTPEQFSDDFGSSLLNDTTGCKNDVDDRCAVDLSDDHRGGETDASTADSNSCDALEEQQPEQPEYGTQKTPFAYNAASAHAQQQQYYAALLRQRQQQMAYAAAAQYYPWFQQQQQQQQDQSLQAAEQPVGHSPSTEGQDGDVDGSPGGDNNQTGGGEDDNRSHRLLPPYSCTSDLSAFDLHQSAYNLNWTPLQYSLRYGSALPYAHRTFDSSTGQFYWDCDARTKAAKFCGQNTTKPLSHQKVDNRMFLNKPLETLYKTANTGKAGRKPYSGVFGLCRQETRWTVVWRNDDNAVKKRAFNFFTPHEEVVMLQQAKRFMRWVIQTNRKVNVRDGEGLTVEEIETPVSPADGRLGTDTCSQQGRNHGRPPIISVRQQTAAAMAMLQKPLGGLHTNSPLFENSVSTPSTAAATPDQPSLITPNAKRVRRCSPFITQEGDTAADSL